MKISIYSLLFATVLVSCMAYQGFYKVGLKKVERSQNDKEKYGESKIVNFEIDGKISYAYKDDMIEIVWIPAATQFNFTLRNLTDHSIKIIWDEAAYIDQNGSSRRITHAGVKYIDRNNPQPPSVIAKNANIDDVIIPTDNIYFISGKYGGWSKKPLFDNKANTKESLNKITKQYVGKEVRILLPLKIQKVVNEYIFTFKVEAFISK